MDLVGIRVKHKSCGEGIVVSENNGRIIVRFSNDFSEPFSKTFLSSDPMLFRKYLTAIDPSIQSSILLDSFSGYTCFEFDGISYYSKDCLSWCGFDFAPVSDSVNEKICSAYKAKLEMEKRKSFYNKLREKPLSELLNCAKDLSKRINESMSKGNARPANLANPSEKTMAYTAVSYLEVAFDKILSSRELSDYDVDEYFKVYIPMLCARYRNIGKPELCYNKLYKNFVRWPRAILTHEFYTSLSAAFCDMSDLDGALEYIEIALKLNRDRETPFMSSVLERIKYLENERLELLNV